MLCGAHVIGVGFLYKNVLSSLATFDFEEVVKIQNTRLAAHVTLASSISVGCLGVISVLSTDLAAFVEYWLQAKFKNRDEKCENEDDAPQRDDIHTSHPPHPPSDSLPDSQTACHSLNADISLQVALGRPNRLRPL